MARLKTRVELTAAELFGAARRIAMQILPYCAKGLYRLRERQLIGFAPVGAYPIAMTAGGVVLWDPQFWGRKPAAMLACALLHELGHWLRNHAGRRGERDPRRWNVAGDAEINDDLKPAIQRRFKDEPAVLQFAATWIYPDKLGCADGQLAEYYYAKADEPKNPQQGQDGEQGDEDDDEQHDHGDPSNGGQGDKERRPCCGSASGNKHPDEGDIDKEMGQTPYAAEAIRRAVALDVKEHFSSKPGSASAGWARWADGVLQPPKVRWQETMSRRLRRSQTLRHGKTFASFEMVSRRQSVYGTKPGSIIVPARVSPVFNLVIVIDTSGSMHNELLIRCVSEVKSILSTMPNARITFCTVDVDVHDIHTVKSINDVLRNRLPGGGGTIFNNLFELFTAQRKKHPCDMMLVLTDGYVMVSTPPPPFPVLWGLVGGNTEPPTLWGTTIVIDFPEAEAA